MDNGEYLRSAEMAEEANYNMIDGMSSENKVGILMAEYPRFPE